MILEAAKTEIQDVESKTTTRIALIVEYDGTNYFGSQLQANQNTVQLEIEKALKKLTGENIRIGFASRTDTGVHARGQVVSFKTTMDLRLEAFVHGLNHYLPEDIAVHSANKAAPQFDPRRMATSREYTYKILNSTTRSPLTSRFAHRVAGIFNIALMNAACQKLIGTHDFASFASDIGDEPGMSTIRNMEQASVTCTARLITICFKANAFLHHQVRNTAGAIMQVGLGKLSVDEFGLLLEAKKPGVAGPALPACGLCLVRVNYPFTIEEMKS
jgi:tRNA pseudouridine38-40 synthase